MQKILSIIIALTALTLCYSCGSKNNDPNPDGNTTKPPVSLAITDFSPKSAKAGDTVTITGTAFGTSASAIGVKFGASGSVQPQTVSDAKMTVVVPADATTGTIQITANGASVASMDNFTLVKTTYTILTTPTDNAEAAFDTNGNLTSTAASQKGTGKGMQTTNTGTDKMQLVRGDGATMTKIDGAGWHAAFQNENGDTSKMAYLSDIHIDDQGNITEYRAYISIGFDYGSKNIPATMTYADLQAAIGKAHNQKVLTFNQ